MLPNDKICQCISCELLSLFLSDQQINFHLVHHTCIFKRLSLECNYLCEREDLTRASLHCVCWEER